MADFDKAIQLDPNNALAYACRGTVWGVQGVYDKAIADLDRAIRLDPRQDLAYNSRGTAWLAKKEYDKAIVNLSEDLRLYPKDVSAYSNARAAWVEKQEYDKALSELTAPSAPPRAQHGLQQSSQCLAREAGIRQGHRRLHCRHQHRSGKCRSPYQPRCALGRKEGIGTGHRQLQRGDRLFPRRVDQAAEERVSVEVPTPSVAALARHEKLRPGHR